MDIEISAEAKNKALNRNVAVTVVVLSVFLGLAKIKDDNLVQAMQQAKADAVDTWGEYQAAKTKRHITQGAADFANPAKYNFTLLEHTDSEDSTDKEWGFKTDIARNFALSQNVKLAIGASVTRNWVSDTLSPLYDGNPTGGLAFIRLKIE